MPRREQIDRERVRAQIHVQDRQSHGNVCIFCPLEVAEGLHRHLVGKQIAAEEPRLTGISPYPQDVLIVTTTYQRAQAEIDEFVAGLPDVCYERDARGT